MKIDVHQFNEYLSDIRIEVAILQVNKSKRDSEETEQHFSNINRAISGITELVLDYFEKTGKREIFLPRNTMPDNKTIVGSAIKQALLEIGKLSHDKVVEDLYREYQCNLADCFEHPKYLNKILKDIFGMAHTVVVEKIKEQLGEISYQKPIEQFLVVISK